jgi:membrane-bound lytic murein transglycosylase D
MAPASMKPAEAAKRVGMSEDALRSINNIPPRMLIKAGSSLLVTRATHQDKDVTLQLADNGQMLLSPDVIVKRKVLKAGKVVQGRGNGKVKASTQQAKRKVIKPTRLAKR